eukprot:GEMP01071345.1.p1 GENE.GEMP01071345.1~~GEMP01071345.1.p1  ORF type:complete len:208 (+),score=24.68 GEMP01071345.1:74-625(+)
MIAATKAVAKAIPKAWAAKAKAFAAAKAAMPLGGPPQPRQALEDCLDNMDGAPTHRALRARAHAAPAKAAKAKAKANPKAGATGPGGHLLDGKRDAPFRFKRDCAKHFNGIGRIEEWTPGYIDKNESRDVLVSSGAGLWIYSHHGGRFEFLQVSSRVCCAVIRWFILTEPISARARVRCVLEV